MAFPGTYNFNYYAGDTFEFFVYPKNSTGGVFDDLSDYDATFIIATARASEFDPFILDEKPYIENDIIKNSSGEEIVIVHQYNRNDEWLDLIYKRFKTLDTSNRY